MTIDFKILENCLSKERLNKYLPLTNNNKEKALILYKLYMSINESLYLPLQNIELIVRNSFYNAIAINMVKIG
ncbi:MAG: hypothetical protein LBH46_04495 [Rickettsiales bacterium]|jgi:hypothetical protein|nr:hypothetical protein [Rickettsiales bacterium]